MSEVIKIIIFVNQWILLFSKLIESVKIIFFIKKNILLNFLFIIKSWKDITVSTHMWSATVFNINNHQKCFLSSKSVYYYDFWRSCDTEDCSNDAENTDYILQYIQIVDSGFKL